MLGQIIGGLFGGSRNVVTEVAEVFRPNSENDARREAEYKNAALSQLSREFDQRQSGAFNGLVNGMNRLPRPMLALGVLGLFASSMIDPVWFGVRMQGLVLVPDELWILLTTIVGFYFGARELHYFRSASVQKSVVNATSRVPVVVENIKKLRSLNAQTPGVASTVNNSSLTIDVLSPDYNQAVEDAVKGSVSRETF